jgi:hypothetical protein
MSPRIVSALRISRTSLSGAQRYLPCLPLSTGRLSSPFGDCPFASVRCSFPPVDYYGGSVALSLAACRRSRICASGTLARVGSPFVSLPRSLSGVHRRGLFIGPKSKPMLFRTTLTTSCVIRCCRIEQAATGPCFCHWRLGFNQYRLNHARRTCGYYYATCFRASPLCPTCYFPLGLSTPGRSAVLEGSLPSTFCPCGAIPDAPKRRTIRKYILPRSLRLAVMILW